MELFRPTGINELKLVFDTKMETWPPRLPEQPIFYPVTNFPYAAQIAKEWNSTTSEYVGYVTKFNVDDEYISQFEKKVVGGQQHEELWIPAEELEEFNKNITEKIEVVSSYFGDNFTGLMPDKCILKGKSVNEQFVSLASILAYNGMDFHCEITANSSFIFLHYPYWESKEFNTKNLSGYSKEEVLNAIKKVWGSAYPDIKLPMQMQQA